MIHQVALMLFLLRFPKIIMKPAFWIKHDTVRQAILLEVIIEERISKVKCTNYFSKYLKSVIFLNLSSYVMTVMEPSAVLEVPTKRTVASFSNLCSTTITAFELVVLLVLKYLFYSYLMHKPSHRCSSHAWFFHWRLSIWGIALEEIKWTPSSW